MHFKEILLGLCFSDPFETLLVDSIVSNELKPAAKLFDYSLLDSL